MSPKYASFTCAAGRELICCPAAFGVVASVVKALLGAPFAWLLAPDAAAEGWLGLPEQPMMRRNAATNAIIATETRRIRTTPDNRSSGRNKILCRHGCKPAWVKGASPPGSQQEVFYAFCE